MIARLVGVTKTYVMGGARLDALADIDLSIQRDCFTVLTGASGSGKTTLLNLVGCIDRPSSGQVFVDGQDTSALSDEALSDFRASSVGFIFQSFNLIPVLTCEENVEYPMLLSGANQEHRRRRVRELLNAVGLRDHASHLPGQLSGGQRQRAAIARALANRPKLVLADEPTANLDSATGASIIALMRDMQQRERTAFVFSSHDPKILSQAGDGVFIRDGRIVDRNLSVSARGDQP